MSAVLYSLTGPTCLHQNLVQTCSLSLHWCQPDEIHVFSYLFFDSVLFDQIKNLFLCPQTSARLYLLLIKHSTGGNLVCHLDFDRNTRMAFLFPPAHPLILTSSPTSSGQQGWAMGHGPRTNELFQHLFHCLIIQLKMVQYLLMARESVTQFNERIF